MQKAVLGEIIMLAIVQGHSLIVLIMLSISACAKGTQEKGGKRAIIILPIKNCNNSAF